MTVTDKTINEIASPLTGFWVTDAEAKRAFNMLMSLDDLEFMDACRRLAHHVWPSESPTNRVKILLSNLGAADGDRLFKRIVETAAGRVLPSLPVPGEAPYATYVKKTHGLVRGMGLGKKGALDLLDSIIAGTLGEKVAPSLFYPLPSVMARLRRHLHHDYQARFRTDNLTGWDKVMHFVKSAQLAFNHDETLAVDAGIAKEIYDEVQHQFGADPEGWSNADIEADLAGVKWGSSLKSQP